MKKRIHPLIQPKLILLPVVFFLALFALSPGAGAETLKIGFVTDWEYGTQKSYGNKLPRKAPKYLKEAVWHYNKKFKPNIVIGGGDYILSRHVSSKRATKQLKKINKKFKKAKVTKRYCIGNHDLNDLSKDEVKRALGIDYTYSVTDMNGFRVITLDTNELGLGDDDYETTGRVPEEELSWLSGQMDTDLPIVVFSHHSPVRVGGGSNRRSIYNDGELRDVLEERGNVVAVFSGHTPENYITELNGIRYVVINNLSDKYARKTHADISLEKESGNVSVSVLQRGKDPESYSFSKELN